MLLIVLILLSVSTSNLSGIKVDLALLQNLLKPVFVKVPPKNLYVTPSIPAIVECVVKDATDLHINCLNDQDTIRRTSTSSLLDQSKDSIFFQKGKIQDKDQVDQISKSVEGNLHSVNFTLREKTVESWFVRQFWCQCEAAFQQDQTITHDFVTSQKSYIEIAYIDKTFKQEPNSASLYLGRYAKLTCIAPDGNPKPKIYWKKDGRKLTISDTTKIQISEDGSLVIFSTSQSDNGIYQCVAFNEAGTKISNKAKLEVLVSDEGGDWLPWTPWNACPSHCSHGKYCADKCLKYLRRRSRLCKSNGKDKIKCPGPSLQTESCARVCRVDGEWSKWSEWSICHRDCTRRRTRMCDSPGPQSGGQHCVPRGHNVIKENCSMDLCPHLEIPLSQTRFVFRDMVVYLVLSISLFLLIIIATTVICLQKKQYMFSTRSEFLTRKSDVDKGQFILLKSLNEKEILHKKANCDSFGTFTNNSHNNSTTPINDTLLKMDSSISTVFCTPSTVNADISFRNALASMQVSFPTNSTSYHYKEGDLSTSTMTNKYQPILYPSLSHPIPLSKVQEDKCHTNNIPVTNKGGKVVLGSTGVSVIIMPDTFDCNDTIYLELCTKYYNESLIEFRDHTQLSSIIFCSLSKDVKLNKPIIVTFPHCIYSKSMSSWEIKVVRKECDLEWKAVLTMDNFHKSPGTIYCHLDEEYCYIMTMDMSPFCILGHSISSLPSHDKSNTNIKYNPVITNNVLSYNFHQPILLSGKRLCVICFRETSSSPGQLQLSIYICIDTKDTRDYIISKIISTGCRICDIPRVLSINYSTENIYLSMKCSLSCWKTNSKQKIQEIPFADIWNIGMEPFIKKSVQMVHLDKCIQSFNAVLTVYQDNFFKDKVDISVAFNSSDIQSMSNKSSGQMVLTQPLCKFIIPSKTFRLPRSTIRELAHYLDPPKLSVSQWLMVAKQIGITNNLEYFLNQSSPTTYLLMLWEAKNREETAIVDLKSTLKVIGLADLASIFK